MLRDDQFGLQTSGASRHWAGRFGTEGWSERQAVTFGDWVHLRAGAEELAGELIALDAHSKRHRLTSRRIRDEGFAVCNSNAGRTFFVFGFASDADREPQPRAFPDFEGSKTFFVVLRTRWVTPERGLRFDYDAKPW